MKDTAKTVLEPSALIVWDYNGTIIADASLWVKAAIAYYHHLGHAFSEADMTATYDTPITVMARNLGVDLGSFPKDSLSSAEALFHGMLKEGMPDVGLRPGVTEALAAVQSKGFAQIVASNHDQDRLDPEVEQRGIRPYFESVSGRASRGEILTRTTKGERIESAIGRLAFPKSRVIIVGDSPEEFRLARELGIRSIGVLGGYASRERQLEAGHAAVIGEVSELPAALADLGF